MRLGALEFGIILLIVLIVFGPGKLTDLGGALGKGIREFRKGTAGRIEPDEETESDADKPDEA